MDIRGGVLSIAPSASRGVLLLDSKAGDSCLPSSVEEGDFVHLPLELITQSELDQARIDRGLGDDAKRRAARKQLLIEAGRTGR